MKSNTVKNINISSDKYEPQIFHFFCLAQNECLLYHVVPAGQQLLLTNRIRFKVASKAKSNVVPINHLGVRCYRWHHLLEVST